jgi:acyl phosphate:glycerol-3-phosphate acyltransferase
MEHFIIFFFSCVAAYLLGSIPTSVWIGRWFFDTDVREHGSGNAGTTNTFRVLGVVPGIVVFIVDILKGFLAVSLIYLMPQLEPETARFVNVELILGSLAVIGHIFPVYVGFKGGKGVATMMGIVLAIHPFAALICLGVFTVSLLISKYVSLSSMIAGLIFPFLVIFLFKETIISLIIFSILVSVLLILTHQKNIVRLVAHRENKVSFKRKHKRRV